MRKEQNETLSNSKDKNDTQNTSKKKHINKYSNKGDDNEFSGDIVSSVAGSDNDFTGEEN